ncbi:efflux transporter outer membrane subunit [uncultured Paraglaciecola sp.]|uniref:efflux transporter outer membrane subunit n=1 Tax=uncultured Paraglaciecola sp. TaxID=1765024 RepID=UPI002634E114|nr:TolC family protein [uncultured Paraglaciecola sp.]
MSIRCIPLFSIIFLSACASVSVPDDSKILENVPSEWATDTTQGAVEASWWLGFNDPVLTSLIEEALLKNPRLLQTKAQTSQALAQATIAGANRLPQLSASLSPSKQKVLSSGGQEGTNRIISESYGSSLNVSWEVDLWGRLSVLSAAAQAEFLASKQNFRAVQTSIAAQTAKAYFSVIEARQQVALSQSTVDIIEETTRQVSNRADAGVVAPTDKLLAINNLEMARAGLALRQNMLQNLTRQLETLLGNYPNNSIETPQHLPIIPSLPKVGVPADLLKRRPDLMAAELGLKAAGFREAASRKALLPSITLTGSAGFQSNEFSELLKGNFSVWSIAGQLVQPIFQGGRLRANVDFSKAQQQAAAQAYVELALSSFFEVEAALASEAFLQDRETAFVKASDASSEAQRIALNRYEQGVTLFLTVLESQQRALDTRSALIETRLSRLNNRIDLHLALGGGFEANHD